MATLTFKGGIHPYDGKELTKDKPIRNVLPKGDLVYPMQQHIGAPAKPVVKKGDRVLAGQKIAEAGIANEHSVVQPNLTISQGYACFVPEGTESGARLIEHADKALYYVKRNSRNAYYIIRE